MSPHLIVFLFSVSAMFSKYFLTRLAFDHYILKKVIKTVK